MTSHVNYANTRDDFRCGICRQKNIFHCEHDTPYRDQYLGTYDSNTPRTTVLTNRRSTSHTGMYHSSASNDGRNVKSNPGTPYQQGQSFDTTTVVNRNANGSSETFEQNKKSKSCVIL